MVRSVPVCDESGRVVRRFGTASDIDDRRRAEEALRASEQRFRFLAESIPHLVWTCGPDGVVDYASPRLLEYLGIAPDRPAAPHLDRIAGIPRIVADRRGLGCCLREWSEYHIQHRLRGADGEYRWFLGHALPQCDDAGRPAGWYGTCTDIDSRWRGQQEIERLNRNLKARIDESETLFETIPIGIAIAEDGRRADSGLPGLERLLEMPSGTNASVTAPPGERPEHFRFRREEREIPPDDLPMQVAAREGRPVIGDTLEIIFADRRTKVIHGNAAPLFDEDGRPRGAVGEFMDITEWRRVETALADSEGRLRLAVEATDLGLFDRDLLTGELRWSAHTKAIFGLSADHPITFDRFLAMIHPEDRERIGAAIDRAGPRDHRRL